VHIVSDVAATINIAYGVATVVDAVVVVVAVR